MRQILAIFTKDARRFWPEILVSLGLLLALDLAYPRQWSGTDRVGSGSFGFWFSAGSGQGLLADALIVLVPVAWWILITRLIHCERLVGDTQFWITRPYEWPKLAVAKALFLAAFLYLPFFAAQCCLLHEGGFHPFSYLPGLLLNLFYFTVVLVLPLTVLSAVTTGFGRMTLLLLGVILFFILAAIVSDYLPSSTFGSVPDIISGDLGLGILLCGCTAIVLMQYSRHKVRLTWFLLGAVAAGLWALAIFDPDQALMSRQYPPRGAVPVQLVYAAGDLSQPMTSETNSKDMLSIAIPLRESGVAENDAVVPIALRATIEGPGGAAWQSSWQGITSERYLPGTSDSTQRFVIPRSVYEHFKPVPVTLRLSFALVQARRASATVIALPRDDFSVAGFGVCKPTPWFGRLDEYSGITCRSAMNQPRLTYITAQWTDGHCAEASSGTPTGTLGTAWAGELDPAPAEFGITSVWNTQVNLSSPWTYQTGESRQPRSLCPGSPVSFTQFREAGRVQADLVIPNFHLPELSLGDQYMILRAH